MADESKAVSTFAGADLYIAGKEFLHTQFQVADQRLGGVDRLVREANRPGMYWEFKKLQVRMQPKDVHLTTDRSVEALIAALDAQKAGKEIVVENVAAPTIGAKDAEFSDIISAPTLWPEAVVRSRS